LCAAAATTLFPAVVFGNPQERMKSLEGLRRDVDKERRKAEKKFKRQEAKVSDGEGFLSRLANGWGFVLCWVGFGTEQGAAQGKKVQEAGGKGEEGKPCS
jgi:hypothetical protein